MQSIYITITAHSPLSRIETTLKVLKGYESLELEKEIEIVIDYNSRHDLDEFSMIVASHTKLERVAFAVAGPEYEGFKLCWAHKPTLINRIREKTHDFYMYSENDMVFTKKHFDYWFKYKDYLRSKNLEPGFCRVEKIKERLIPFDNYRQWNLLGDTEKVWGDIPYRSGLFITPYETELVGFTSLGNPYNGMIILDQHDADIYIETDSCDPLKSYARTGKRNWPIADRSSMGLAFENIPSGREHRRVVPLAMDGDTLTIPDFALLEHLDNKYSSVLSDDHSMIDTKNMFTY